MKKYILVILTSLIFLSSCIGEKRIGFYYPNKDDLNINDKSEELKSLDECRNWIKSKGFNKEKNDYECGKNCKLSDYGMYICDETIR